MYMQNTHTTCILSPSLSLSRVLHIYFLILCYFRFVNHVTEKGQDKSYAQPVHKVALDVSNVKTVMLL